LFTQKKRSGQSKLVENVIKKRLYITTHIPLPKQSIMPPKRNRVDDDDYEDVEEDTDEDFIDEGDDDDDVFASKKGGRKRGRGRKGGKRGAGSGSDATVLTKGGSRGLAAATSKWGDDLDDPENVFQDFTKSLTLKKDHANRPIWVTQDAVIYLEAFSVYYKQAYDFLVAIAEPQARPKFIHTYRLTENSLYAAVALSIDTETIIKTLNRLSKTDIPLRVVEYIRDCTYTFGKAKLVLKNNKFYVESQFPDVLRELLKNPTIKSARIFDQLVVTGGARGGVGAVGAPQSLASASATATASGHLDGFIEADLLKEDSRNKQFALDIDGVDDEEDDDTAGGSRQQQKTVSFMIAQELVQAVKKSAQDESKYPLMEEFSFKDDSNPALPILEMDLRPSTKIRAYQEKSLTKMFGNGRARSGIIVLPCGAGKSLTGVTAATTIKRSTVVVCINNASVIQWRGEFLRWTNLSSVYEPSHPVIKIFTSHRKDPLPSKDKAAIIITTYSMLCHGGHRSASGEMMIKAIKEREWGLMILDEVHVAPAEQFQKVLQIVNSHCKLGLTATLVREDNKIRDLNFLVGPKLYEANWIDLTEQGFLARVKCVEVWCPMTKEFYAEYIKGSSSGQSNSRLQRLLYNLNPTKFRSCEYLVKYHAARGDKIIIFSDDLPALILYCSSLKGVLDVPYIYGETPHADRENILKLFKQRSTLCPCIGLSKVGDTALDIPEANVIIQVSSHFGARRQEAQRLGRILRPKANPSGGFNAFFYTLVSTDTREMYFSTKRQQYLIDQGYTFQVVQDLAEKADQESKILRTKSDEIALLNQVLKFEYLDYDSKEDRALARANDGDDDEELPPPQPQQKQQQHQQQQQQQQQPTVSRKTASLGAKSGAEGKVYSEFSV